ncbi:MAG: trypsin-like peptidase domain-containing protein [Bacteroidetes bacterium]|nr:trypsin-like peptidase domain-containing protein [Bacteroidota bacterium]
MKSILITLTIVFNTVVAVIRAQNDIYNSTVHLIGYTDDEEGNTVDTITGTAFIFMFLAEHLEESNLVISYPFLVSNYHVVSRMDRAELRFTKRKKSGHAYKPDYGNTFTVAYDNFKYNWIRHPDPNVDLAISPMAPILEGARSKNIKLYYYPLTNNILPSNDEWGSIDQVENAIMIGYPKALMDTVNNLPITRTGTLATPLNLDYNGKEEFLLDVPVYPGSSGSPVFLKRLINPSAMTYPPQPATYEYKLIGIAYGSMTYKSKGTIEIINIPTIPTLDFKYDLPLNIAVCIKSNQLFDFVPIIKELLNE